MLSRTFAGAVACFAIMTGAVQAEGLRIRGELTNIDGNVYTIQNASGQMTEVTISEPVILEYKNITLDEVAANAYVSVPSVALDGQTRRALGVSVFPNKMRGMNEGFADWDLTSGSKMTNATVAKVLSRGGERVLTLGYAGNEQVVVVPLSAPVTTFGPNPERKLAVGDLVVVFAEGESGIYSGKYVGVHKDGSLPPV